MTTILAMRVCAGVAIPDTPLIAKVIDFARAHSTDYAFNHIQRSMLLGFIVAHEIPEVKDRDLEVHAVSALLHDIGWDPTNELVSTDKRFEVDGANTARDFLRKEAPEWDKYRFASRSGRNCSTHTTGSIVFHKEIEVQACAYGIWADFQGPDRVSNGLLSWDEYNAVVKVFPRLKLMEGLKKVMCRLCQTKPQTTYDNTVGEWGDKYVEGYSRKGKLTQDLLETCNLDDL